MLTLDQAFTELAKLTASGKATTQQLMDLAAKVTLDTASGYSQGSVTLLYSGEINGVRSSKYIADMIDEAADIRVVDKTQLGRFLAQDDIFKAAWLAAGGTEAQLYHGADGPWAKASSRFVGETVGEVRFLGFSPKSSSVFVMTELKKAIADGSRITSIEGISVADLRRMSLGEALKSVTSASVEHAGYSGFRVTAGSVTVGEFLKREVLDTQTYIKNNPEAVQRFQDFWKSCFTEAEAGRIKAGARGVMKRLGIIGSALVLGIAMSDSAKAAESGDTEKSRKIMEVWALDAAGSSAGAAIGSALVAVAVAGAAGVATISTPVLVAVGIGAAIVGGIFGSKGAQDAWAKYRGSADDSELNLLEKLAAKWALSDYNLVFGTKESDSLTGTDEKDYLFGGGGADTLVGKAGDDALAGGADADTLTGGIGDDKLFGGSGYDTYQFAPGDGEDTVIDSDGQGCISVGADALLTGGRKAGLNYWLSDSINGSQFNFTLAANSSGGKDLVIYRLGSNDRIVIPNWQPGQLGITLSDDAYPVVPQYMQGGTAGNDAVFGTGGNDSLDGNGGDDLMIATVGEDTLNGGGGRDYIFGSAYGDIPMAGLPSDYVAPGPEYSRGTNWVAYDGGYDSSGLYHQLGIFGFGNAGIILNDGTSFIDGGAGNDFIYAGTGNDLVHGGADDDEIDGLDGNDIIDGDDGNDKLWGDGIHTLNWAYTPAERHGMDIIDGGIGNDYIEGQGRNDELYGGAGNDVIWGDSKVLIDTPLAVHGDDYIDGGDGNDTMDGGGGSDEIYGGTGDDNLWGDGAPSIVTSAYQGNDYLDGEDGSDCLVGGGKDDELFGGESESPRIKVRFAFRITRERMVRRCPGSSAMNSAIYVLVDITKDQSVLYV